MATGSLVANRGDQTTRLGLAARLEAVEVAEDALLKRIERIGAARADVLDLSAPLISELHQSLRYVRNTARFALHAETRAVDPMDFFVMASLAIHHAFELQR